MTEIDTYQKGKFKLEEWEDVNYCEHDFYKNDEGLTDKEIVDLLNEQEETIHRLKRTMESVAELLSIDVDLFSNKAIEHDMNAYIELKKLNKDVYIMALSIKKAIKMLRGDV